MDPDPAQVEVAVADPLAVVVAFDFATKRDPIIPVGEAKAAMLRRLVEGDATIPAGRVARAQATVIADVAAAVMLSDADPHID